MGLSCKDVCGNWSQSLTEAQNNPVKRKPQSQTQEESEPLECPRCDSRNTKFCYYNNYSKSQPRHFCRSCKRHWTRGGTLRDVPVGGGGGRRNKRLKASAAAPEKDSARIDAQMTTNPSLGNDDQRIFSPVLQYDFIRGMEACGNMNEMFVNSFPFLSQNGNSCGQFEIPHAAPSPSPVWSSADYSAPGRSETATDSSANHAWNQQVPASSGLVVEGSYWKLDDEIDPVISVDFNLPWDDDSEGIRS